MNYFIKYTYKNVSGGYSITDNAIVNISSGSHSANIFIDALRCEAAYHLIFGNKLKDADLTLWSKIQSGESEPQHNGIASNFIEPNIIIDFYTAFN